MDVNVKDSSSFTTPSTVTASTDSLYTHSGPPTLHQHPGPSHQECMHSSSVVRPSDTTTTHSPVAAHQPPPSACQAVQMPSVPPTFLPLDSDPHGLLPAVSVLTASQHTDGPTPDPDLDDGVLVSVVTGDGVGAVTSPDSSLLRQDEARAEAFKPLICLSDLSLHSPSAIVGTPFDVSPRFEYPFPEDSSSSDSSIFGPSPFIPSYHSPVTFHPSIPTNRSYSPTHPKHTLRDPPVPPGLAKKRWSVGISMPLRHSRKRSRSANAVPSEEVSSGSMRAHMTQPGTETFDGAEDAGKPGVVAEEMTRPQRIDAGPNAAWGVVPSEDASASAESSLLDEYTKSLEEQNILNAVVEDEYEAQRPSTAPSSLI